MEKKDGKKKYKGVVNGIILTDKKIHIKLNKLI